MATSSSNTPEEARPPELLYRKQQYRKNVDLHAANNSSCQNAITNQSNDTTCLVNQRSTRILGLRNVLFPKRKISCITSTASERNLTDLSIIHMPKDNSGKIVSTPVALANSSTHQQEERPKTRHSVHLDVDEALSSLLWQPYEYQNANNNNNHDRYSLSSCDDSNCSCSSGSGGSSRSDLAKTQEHFGASTANQHTYGNNGNNMVAVDYLLDSSGTYNSGRRVTSRRRTVLEGGCGGSRDGVALNVAYLANARDSLYPYVAARGYATTPAVTTTTNTSSLLYSQPQYIHGAYPNGGTMRADLPQPALVPTTPALLPTLLPRPSNNNINNHRIVEITTNNVPNMVLPLGGTGNGNTISAASSLHTANVVGIPQHSRQSSIPSATIGSANANISRGSTVIFPNHPRTASEPVPQQRYHQTTANVVPIQRQHVESHLRAAQTAANAPNRPSTNSSIFHQPPLDLMTGVLKHDFNTPHQRAPLDLSIHGTATTGEHLNIVHRMIPEQSKPQLSITHQRIPSDFNGSRNADCSSSSCTAAVPSQLHITHQRTVSDIAQSSTVRNDPANKVAVAATPGATRTTVDTNNRMVPEITNNANVVHHQRSSSIPNNSKNTTGNNAGGVLNVSNVNVNYYRAVPVNVVSAVPTIHCVNTNESLQQQQNASTAANTNISNVNIIQAMPSTISNNNSNDSSSTISNLINKPTHSVSTTTLNSNDNNNGTTCTEVIVHNTHDPSQQPPVAPPRLLPPVSSSTRTFTSTEAQTDEIISTAALNAITSITSSTSGTQQQSVVTSPVLDPVKEQRRRERRERKHQRRMNNVNHRHSSTNPPPAQTQAGTTSIEQWSGSTNPPQTNDRLPDILNSHLPPPYSTTTGTTSLATGPPPHIIVGYHPAHHGILPHQQGLSASGVVVPPGGPMVPPGVAYHGPVMATAGVPGGQVPLVSAGSAVHHSHLQHQAVPVVPVVPSSGFRFPFAATGFRRSRYSDDHPPKGCCGLLSWKPGSLRWFIALIALVAVCCVLVGTALGAMRPAGRDHLTVSLLMIGVGIVLVTVSAIAWRLTSHSPTTSCRSILGLSPSHSTLSLSNPAAACPNSASGNSRRFIPRLPPAYGGGRPHHPYAAMLYPEFQYRPPPPTYQASMQEYRLRLLLLDRVGLGGQTGGVVASPPPTYRSGYGPGGTLGSSIGAGSLLRSTLSHRRALHTPGTHPPSMMDLAPGSIEYSTSGSIHGNGTTTPMTNPPPSHIILHSRDHSSLTLSSDPGGVGGGMSVGGSIGRTAGSVNVVSILNDGSNGGDAVRLVMNGEGGCFEVVGDLDSVVDDMKLDGGPLDPTGITSDHFVAVTTSSKVTDDPDNLSSSIKSDNNGGGNLVTIVQTGDDQSPVIVHMGQGATQLSVLDHHHNHHHHNHHHQIGYDQLVNNRNGGVQITEIGSADGMEILAHL